MKEVLGESNALNLGPDVEEEEVNVVVDVDVDVDNGWRDGKDEELASKGGRGIIFSFLAIFLATLYFRRR